GGNYAKGTSLGLGNAGPGSGVGITFMGGVNNELDDITAEFFSQGIIFNNDGGAGDCQGTTIDGLEMVECIEGIHGYGTPGGGFGSHFLNSWMIDNGNLNLPNHRSIVLDN